MQRFLVIAMFLALLGVGCGDDDGGAGDAGTTDASGLDAGDSGLRIEDLPLDEEMTMPVLQSAVDVVDEPHQYSHPGGTGESGRPHCAGRA